MSFIDAIRGYGWKMQRGTGSVMSSSQRENRKQRFTRDKKAQRLARRANR